MDVDSDRIGVWSEKLDASIQQLRGVKSVTDDETVSYALDQLNSVIGEMDSVILGDSLTEDKLDSWVESLQQVLDVLASPEFDPVKYKVSDVLNDVKMVEEEFIHM